MNDKAIEFSRIFAVADPERMVQAAFLKAEAIAKLNGASIKLYCCRYDEAAAKDPDLRRRKIATTRGWLERVVAPTRDAGIDVEIVVDWSEDWRRAMVDAAVGSGCNLVVKAYSRHTAVGRLIAETSDWMLLGEAVCPSLLVNNTMPDEDRKLLAAIKLKPQDASQEELNRQIIDLSHFLAEQVGFELHAATAWRGDEVYYDRQAFATMCRLPRNRVLSVEGAPQKAIAEAAAQVGADTIVIGHPGDSETAQRLIDQVTTDILVLPGR